MPVYIHGESGGSTTIARGWGVYRADETRPTLSAGDWYLVDPDDVPANKNDLIGKTFENLTATTGATLAATQPAVSVTYEVPDAAAVNTYTSRLLALANVTWIYSESGDSFTVNDRWSNWHYWIGSMHKIVKAVIADTSQTDAVKAYIWESYQSLAPADPERLATWYVAHTDTIYTAYRADLGGSDAGNARAYMNATLTGTDVPAFASDAASSIAWNGTNNTLDVTISRTWRSPSDD